MNLKSFFLQSFIFGFAVQTFSAVVGTNVPASPLTAARIQTLPATQQAAWKNYLERSTQQMEADKSFLRDEMKRNGIKNFSVPRPSKKHIPFDNSADWFGGNEARHIADVIVSFQTPAGGWSKNLDMATSPRAPGQTFAAENAPTNQPASDNDMPIDRYWNYVGTFDNDATTTQLRFLAKVISANTTNTASFSKSFLRGMNYIFAAQFPNGGWPQVWPLQGGYHDAITFNDGAMENILQLLQQVAAGTNEFTFVPPDVRVKADASFKRGINCILATQVIANGRRTAWCQQHDALTLQPTSARNYEMPALSSAESAGLMEVLMQLPNPDSNVVMAVRAVAAWLEKTKIEGKAYKMVSGKGRELIDAPESGPLWSRYYEIGTDRPIFGDRDKSIHDEVNEISLERRNGYGWLRDTPKRMLEHFSRWNKKHPQ
jgi:PelA/Pel-15E family pectate lyase